MCLSLYLDMQDFPGALPRAGGLLDQDQGLMGRIRIVGQEYERKRPKG